MARRIDVTAARALSPLGIALFAAVMFVTACSAGSSSSRPDEPLLVAAASDLRPAFTELASIFTQKTGHEVAFVFGSSGLLAQQAIEGAPFDIYASASADYVDVVLARGVGDPTTRTTYAYGRITLWTADTERHPWTSLDDLVTDSTITTVAIANPAHAPYGLAAKQSLIQTGIWDDIRPRLVYGANIGDVQRLVTSGNADAAILALSLALAADEHDSGRWMLIDDALHAPLQQELVITASGPARVAAASAFLELVASGTGRETLRRYGLLLPGETVLPMAPE